MLFMISLMMRWLAIILPINLLLSSIIFSDINRLDVIYRKVQLTKIVFGLNICWRRGEKVSENYITFCHFDPNIKSASIRSTTKFWFASISQKKKKLVIFFIEWNIRNIVSYIEYFKLNKINYSHYKTFYK